MRALVLVLLSGCLFNNVSSEERLRDSVMGLNDEARWNRFDLATQRVAPPFRLKYRATHHQWHRALQIADSEIVNVEMGESRAQATSYVTVRWYDQRTMLLAETTLKQKWRRTTMGYVLVDEEVAEGNPSLLELPEGQRSTEDDSDEGEVEVEDITEEVSEPEELAQG